MNPRSKITAQGQISVPAQVRRDLGAGPGETLEWEKRDGEYVVRKAGGMTFAEMRQKLWGNRKFKRVSLKEMDEAIARGIIERYERSRH
jgi:antitoxin PrlF